jgi:hypothetical protein
MANDILGMPGQRMAGVRERSRASAVDSAYKTTASL